MNGRPFYEFFAGGGMARMGLGPSWHCAFANDFDPVKAEVYRANWDYEHFRQGDINGLSTSDLPGRADLAWASFPCQDLSLAGNSAGLGTATAQTRSGAFWAFWSLMEGLVAERRAPKIIVLENVYGSLTANEGRDFAVICRCLALANYHFGAVILDAVHFLPHSRPRVFLVAACRSLSLLPELTTENPVPSLHPRAMIKAVERLAEVDQSRWVWWRVPSASKMLLEVDDLLQDDDEVVWQSPEETQRLVDMMSALNQAKLTQMLASSRRRIGTIYKRTRVEAGRRVQRAELRDDGIAGCLRTPGGGSSRQLVIVAENGQVRSRLLSAREAARLMGLPDAFKLPERYNDAYHLAGDGLAVPVVNHLARAVIDPLLDGNEALHAKVAA